MRILFISNFYGEYFFQAAMADALKDQGVEPVFVSRSIIPEDPRVQHWSDLASGISRSDVNAHLEQYVGELEKKYGVKLGQICFSDLILGDLPPRAALIETVVYFKTWERFFQKAGIDYYFWFCDGDAIFRSAHYVARRSGVASFTRVPVPIPNAHAWHDNEFDVWDDYEDRPLRSFSADEVARVRAYIDAVRNRRMSLMLVRNPAANFIGHKVYQFAENVWLKISRERRNPKWRPLMWARQYLTKVGRQRGEQSFYRQPDLTKPYIFFPLQKPKDIQLTVRAQDLRMEDVVSKLADIAPKGMRVVVKGHPTWVGTYPVEMFTRLKAKGNVDIVPAGYDALELIRHAKAIVTINNTVGYEAVLLRRPVVTMKPTYYTRYGHVAPSLDELGPTLEMALSRGFPWPDEEIERFVANLWAATYPGKSHWILNEKNELLTRRDISRTWKSYRGHAADHGRSVLAKIERVKSHESARRT